MEEYIFNFLMSHKMWQEGDKYQNSKYIDYCNRLAKILSDVIKIPFDEMYYTAYDDMKNILVSNTKTGEWQTIRLSVQQVWNIGNIYLYNMTKMFDCMKDRRYSTELITYIMNFNPEKYSYLHTCLTSLITYDKQFSLSNTRIVNVLCRYAENNSNEIHSFDEMTKAIMGYIKPRITDLTGNGRDDIKDITNENVIMATRSALLDRLQMVGMDYTVSGGDYIYFEGVMKEDVRFQDIKKIITGNRKELYALLRDIYNKRHRGKNRIPFSYYKYGTFKPIRRGNTIFVVIEMKLKALDLPNNKGEE